MSDKTERGRREIGDGIRLWILELHTIGIGGLDLPLTSTISLDKIINIPLVCFFIKCG